MKIQLFCFAFFFSLATILTAQKVSVGITGAANFTWGQLDQDAPLIAEERVVLEGRPGYSLGVPVRIQWGGAAFLQTGFEFNRRTFSAYVGEDMELVVLNEQGQAVGSPFGTLSILADVHTTSLTIPLGAGIALSDRNLLSGGLHVNIRSSSSRDYEPLGSAPADLDDIFPVTTSTRLNPIGFFLAYHHVVPMGNGQLEFGPQASLATGRWTLQNTSRPARSMLSVGLNISYLFR